MDANDGLEISLVVSKRLRRLLLYVTGLAAVAAGFILVGTILFVHLAPRWSAAHATIGVLLMALPIVIWSGCLISLAIWIRAVILARIYRIAAEDTRDVIKDLGREDDDG